MKTYTNEPTKDKDLFRVLDRNGDWTHYYHAPTGKYLRAVNFILDAGYAKGKFFYEWLKNKSAADAEKILKDAGDRGDAIHQFITKIFDVPFREQTIKGEFVEYEFKDVDRLTTIKAEDNHADRLLTNDEWDAILAFATFWKAHEPKLIAYEFPAYDLKLGYAGTGDAIIRITKECEVRSCPCKGLAGKVGLLDWKSGGGIYGSHGAQVAAYSKAGSIKAMLLPEQRPTYTAILRLGTNHKTTHGYQFDVYDRKETDSHFQEFKAAIRISNADYKPFDPATEIVEIPDNLDMKVEVEQIKVKEPVKAPDKKPKVKIKKPTKPRWTKQRAKIASNSKKRSRS